MNNINKKNKIFSLSCEYGVPNKDATVKNNQIIYATINDNLQKLVENDIFIKKELEKELKYTTGPILYPDDNTLKSLPNGYKMWNKNITESVEPISILHKVDSDLSSTIKKLNSEKINFIKNSGYDTLIGTNKDLYKFNLDSNNVEQITSMNVITRGASIPRDTTHCVVNPEDAKVFMVQNNTIHEVLTYTDPYEIITYTSLGTNVNNVYYANDKELYYKNNNDSILYKTKIDDPSKKETIKTTNLDNFDKELVSINNFDDKKFFITKEDGLYTEIEQYSFHEINEINIATNVHEIIKYNSNILALTDKGVYKLQGNNYSPITDNSNNNINDVVKAYCFDEGILYVLINTKIYQVDSSFKLIEKYNLGDSINNSPNSYITLGKYGNDIIVTETDGDINKIVYYNIIDNSITVTTENNAIKSQILFNNKITLFYETGVIKSLDIKADESEDYRLQEYTDIKINKIIRYNYTSYILTNNGIYIDSLSRKLTEFSPHGNYKNITDLYFYTNNWLVIGKDSSGNSCIYLGTGTDFTNYYICTKQCDQIRCSNDIFVIRNGTVVEYTYINDISKNTSSTPKTFNFEKLKYLTTNVKKIECDSNVFYILYDDGKLKRLAQEYAAKLEYHELLIGENVKEKDIKIKGFSTSYSDFRGTQDIICYDSSNIYKFETTDDGEILKYIGNIGSQIKYITQYEYNYNDMLNWDTDNFPNTLNVTYNGSPATLKYCIDFYGDLYTIIDKDDNLKVLKYNKDESVLSNFCTIEPSEKLVNGNNGCPYKTTDTLLINENVASLNVKGMVTLHDQKYNSFSSTPIDSKYGELPQHCRTYVFGTNEIKKIIISLNVDVNNTTLEDGNTTFNIWDSSASELFGECCFYNSSSTSFKLDKLNNLQYVTNVENSSGTPNTLFFATLNADNSYDIKYYIQNTIKTLDEDFNNNNIKTLLSGVDDVKKITATYDGINKLQLAIQTTNKIKLYNYEFNEDDDELISKGEINNIIDTDESIIALWCETCTTNSLSSFSYNNIRRSGGVAYAIGDPINLDISDIKIDNNNLYKIGTNYFYENETIYSFNNIKNITYDNDIYHIICDKGLYTLSSLDSSQISRDILFDDISLNDVCGDIYIENDKYYKKTKYSLYYFDITWLKTLANQVCTNLINDTQGLLYIDEKTQYLNILYNNYTVSHQYYNNEHQVLRNNSNLIIDIHGNIYDKNTNKLITSNLNGFYNTIYPKIKKEVDTYFIRSDIPKKIFKYDNIGNYTYLININNLSKKVISNVFQFDKTKLLMTSGNSIYFYLPKENVFYKRYSTDTSNEIYYIQEESDNYIICDKKGIYQLDKKLRNDSKKILIPSNNTIRTFYKINKNVYLLGSNNGLSATHYDYYIINDIPNETITTLSKKCEDKYNSKIKEHISNDHNENSIIYNINNKLMPSDCSILSGINNNTDINNYVKTIEFGENIQHISAYVNFENELQVEDNLIQDSSYILKTHGKNDTGELLIYLPTTKTNYINHITEIKNDQNRIEKIYRKNVNKTTSRDVNDNKTILTLLIDNDHFDINQIHSIEINGNSLPLKIYIDNDNEKHFRNKNFSTIIKKSRLKELSYNQDNNIIKIQFLIFGTDAQALRLQLENNIRYTIRFHFKDGVKEQSYIIDTDYKIPYDNHIVDGSLFKGWSTDKDATKPDTKMTYGKNGDGNIKTFRFDKKYREQILDYYPIYEEYKFDKYSTVLKVTTDTNPIYFNGIQKDDTLTIVDYDTKESEIIK